MAKVIEVTGCSLCPYHQEEGKDNICLNNDAKFYLIPKETFSDTTFPEKCPLTDKDDYLESEFDIDRDFDDNPKDEKTMPPPFQFHKEAEDEGWGIFYTGMQDATHNLYELQRLDMEGFFPDDNTAIIHVVVMVINKPKGIHAEALLYLAKYSPNEIDSVVRKAVGDETFAELKEVMRYTEFDKF